MSDSITGWWARATPLKNMSSSIGMIRNPIYGKIKLMATKPPTGIWVKVYIICLILTRKKFLGYPKLTQKKSGWSEILPSFGSKKYQWVHPVEKTLSTTHNPSFPQVLVDGCLKILKRVEICWNMLKSWVSTSKTISRFQVQLKKKKNVKGLEVASKTLLSRTSCEFAIGIDGPSSVFSYLMKMFRSIP